MVREGLLFIGLRHHDYSLTCWKESSKSVCLEQNPLQDLIHNPLFKSLVCTNMLTRLPGPVEESLVP